MRSYYLLAALALTLASCDTLTRQRLPGTYQYLNDNDHYHLLNKFELTGDKFITRDFMGKTAMDYTVDGDALYVNSAGVQYPFRIVSSDTLRNEGSMGLMGTYVRVK